MQKFFTLETSDLSLWVVLTALLLVSCSPKVEHKAENLTSSPQATTAPSVGAITVAAMDEPVEEAYFDLIAKTSACLGEDLWIGGKVESTNKVALSKAGAITKQKVYEVKDLTATGLNTNSYYTLRDSAGTLKAIANEEGVLQIQLQEGSLKLLPRTGQGAILVAYQAPSAGTQAKSREGSWHCQ
ncbi:hypothetical protein H9Q13_08890 [Pontibacter sp. JH31]|uniref:Uncharacterized protein n=1 Tax=Pontibacter aquaedesilientis TaxID=2766980 RepID=A0ABR7XG45_9BACT|nr:hypothetical protein [Pontibacter aquaedesilientis]MBD1397278.1 hypothetical protein [Pontibacter aquaedesilientis]